MQTTSKTDGTDSLQTDEDLLAQIAADNHDAYRHIVDKYLPKLWRFAFNVLRNEQEAEDIVQDVLMSVWKNRQSWNQQGPAKFSTWIYRITLNRCIDKKRKNATAGEQVELENEPLEAPSPAPDQGLMNEQRNNRLLNLLGDLPENQRTALLYFYYEDLTIIEISHRMGASEQAVRSLLKRARKTLKEKLESEQRDGPETTCKQPADLRRGSGPLAGRPARPRCRADQDLGSRTKGL